MLRLSNSTVCRGPWSCSQVSAARSSSQFLQTSPTSSTFPSGSSALESHSWSAIPCSRTGLDPRCTRDHPAQSPAFCDSVRSDLALVESCRVLAGRQYGGAGLWEAAPAAAHSQLAVQIESVLFAT